MRLSTHFKGVTRFRVMQGYSNFNYKEGDTLTLGYDDGSDCPFFINERTGDSSCAICLFKLEPIRAKNMENK